VCLESWRENIFPVERYALRLSLHLLLAVELTQMGSADPTLDGVIMGLIVLVALMLWFWSRHPRP
jgi:hypothetical protein